jgi:hypothetical protein
MGPSSLYIYIEVVHMFMFFSFDLFNRPLLEDGDLGLLENAGNTGDGCVYCVLIYNSITILFSSSSLFLVLLPDLLIATVRIVMA